VSRTRIPRNGWERQLGRWMRAWGLPGLESCISIEFTRRLQRSVARCSPKQFRIDLNPRLRGWQRRRLTPILCHEAAHLAVFTLYGGMAQPHGDEWAGLVRSVGYTPTTHCPVLSERVSTQREPRRPTFRFEHRCLACQQVRWSRRRVPGWRCADCVAAGLSGEMVIRDTSAGAPAE
jgi:predicted SprT family Zn-dependent metalloprotease